MSHFTYKRNVQSLGAINNWNSILKIVSTEYFQILHHDEIPSATGYIKEIEKNIKSSKYDTIILTLRDVRKKRVFPKILSSCYLAAIKYMPLTCNMLGAPSVIVTKHKIIPYDNRFKYYVDIEYYHRLFKYSSHPYQSKISLMSLENRNSITNQLDVKKSKNIESVILHETCTFSQRLFSFIVSSFLRIAKKLSW